MLMLLVIQVTIFVNQKQSETNSIHRVLPEGNSSVLECDYSAMDNKDDCVIAVVDAYIAESIKSTIIGKASADQLKQEQLSDETLAGCWRMASRCEIRFIISQ